MKATVKAGLKSQELPTLLTTKVYLHYSYMNLRDAEYPVKMIFEGTLTRSESIDIRTEEEATSH